MSGSYEYSPIPLSNFIDRKYVFPRFQRRTVWDDKQNFELFLSLFKGFPIGVTIISISEIDGRSINFLLDGRQRRNALSLVKSNPESIYKWAKKYCGFKNSDDDQEVSRKFWDLMDQYFHHENEKSDENNSEINLTSEYSFDTDVLEGTDLIIHDGLNYLLNILKSVHPLKPLTSNYTTPLFLGQKLNQGDKRLLKTNSDGKLQACGHKISSIYRTYINTCTSKDLDRDWETFYDWIVEQKLTPWDTGKTKTQVRRGWSEIEKAINAIEIIDDLLTQNKIGLVEAKNYSDTDRQMIFTFINSSGTPLTGIQILSASPNWNKKVDDGGSLLQYRKELYNVLDLPVHDDVVRWDFPAVSASQMSNLSSLIQVPELTEGNLDKRIKIGFKLHSLYRKQGVGGKDIEALGSDDPYWLNPTNMFESYSSVLKKLMKTRYFKTMKSWGVSLQEMTSQNAAFYFLHRVQISYINYESPDSGQKLNKWLNECFALLDKLVHEVATGQWGGSGDSKLARNLKNLSNEDLELIKWDDTWKSLILDSNDNGELMGATSDFRSSKKIIMHIYFTNNIRSLDTGKLHIDHIIPKSRISIGQYAHFTNSLFNLGLLPSELNKYKNDKFLSEIGEDDIQKTANYLQLELADAKRITSTNNYTDLRKSRSSLFDAFEKNRLINNQNENL